MLGKGSIHHNFLSKLNLLTTSLTLSMLGHGRYYTIKSHFDPSTFIFLMERITWTLKQKSKNLGRLWLAYTMPAVNIAQSTGCGLPLTSVVMWKDHGQILIKSAQHFLACSTTVCAAIGDRELKFLSVIAWMSAKKLHGYPCSTWQLCNQVSVINSN